MKKIFLIIALSVLFIPTGIYHTSEGKYYAVEYLNENTESNKVSFRYKLLQ